jgi:trans-aconitate methyltransferase
VAFQVTDLLDPGGSVLGVHQSQQLLDIAESRRKAGAADNVAFRQSDARLFTADQPFDAIIARLLLFHLPDREEVLHSQMDSLRPGGTVVLLCAGVTRSLAPQIVARASPTRPSSDSTRSRCGSQNRSTLSAR